MRLGLWEIRYVLTTERWRQGSGWVESSADVGLCVQGVRAYMQQSRIFVGMVLILIFGEVLGLYGYVDTISMRCRRYRLLTGDDRLIVALILNTRSQG